MNRLLLLGVLFLAAGCATNPVTGKSELVFYSEVDEVRLGDSIHPGVIYEYDGEYQDPELKRYLGTIVLRLHKVSHRPDQPVDFKVLNSSIFNAFAIPGHVYVTRGFLAKLRNEAEFAAVMGHELAHYTARHSVKELTTSRLTGIGMGLASLALPEGSLTEKLVLGAGAIGVKLAGLRYSRSQEEQADRVGTYYLYRAGYDPRRALDMQQLLHSLGGDTKASFLGEYLSTHPTEETRLHRIQEVIEEMSMSGGSRMAGDGTFAERWRRRLAPLHRAQKAYAFFDRGQQIAAKGKLQEALGYCRKAQSMASGQAPMARLEGDILFKMKRVKEARTAYAKALALDRRYLPAVYGLGAVDLNQKNYQGAATHFRACLRLLPDFPDGLLGLGVSAFHLGRYQEAVASLEPLAENVQHPVVLAYLGQSYEKVGQNAKAVKAYTACVESAKSGSKDSPSVVLARKRLEVLGKK